MTYQPENHPQYPTVYAVKPPIMPHAVWSFVLTAIAFVTPFLPFLSLPLSIAGVVLGHLGLSRITKSPIPRSGRGFAIAGLVLGYLAIVAGILWTSFYVGFADAMSKS